MEDAREDISQGPEEPDRSPPSVEGDGPQVHTADDEGHPAGDGERTDREIGGPTAPDDPPEEDATGGAPAHRPAAPSSPTATSRGEAMNTEHNPGEQEFGEHADEAEHNPGEREFGDEHDEALEGDRPEADEDAGA
jgi:hypothetical protein